MIKMAILILALLLGYSGPALAIPMLQLDIEDGVYDPISETTIAASDEFKLYALLKEKSQLGDDFYISAALFPNPNDSAVAAPDDLGSFTIGGTKIDVTGDMVYGVPPLETYFSLQGWDKKDLPSHGIFETYFYEIGFNFNENNKVKAYNTIDRTARKGELYQAAFEINTENLATGYSIHFDLYNTVVKTWKILEDVDIKKFAPFSHDAQSGPGSSGPAPVPEPTTILLLSSGLFVFAGYMRRKKSKS